MSVTSHLEKAEESVRQALINALAEGEDDFLTDLFDQLNSVRDLRKRFSNTIRFTDNTADYYEKLNSNTYPVDLTDLVISTKSGKDLDVMDNIIQFPSGSTEDVITFTDHNPGLTD